LSSAREAKKRWRSSSVESLKSGCEEKISVAGYSPDSNGMNPEAGESSLLEAVAREWLLQTQQAEKSLSV
jgi:hypothetical protein